MRVLLFALFFVCLHNNGTAQATVETTSPKPSNSSDMYATSSTSASPDGGVRMARFSADDEDEEEIPTRERRSPGVRGYVARPLAPPSGGRYKPGRY